jgi:NDP-sugar pyrophosphorylase family protein
VNDLIKKGKKVTHFPIRGYWLDIGTVQNYSKAQDDIRYIRF